MKKILLTALTTVVATSLLVSCKEEGPAEKAGKKIDQTLEEAQETYQGAKEEFHESKENLKEQAHERFDEMKKEMNQKDQP